MYVYMGMYSCVHTLTILNIIYLRVSMCACVYGCFNIICIFLYIFVYVCGFLDVPEAHPHRKGFVWRNNSFYFIRFLLGVCYLNWIMIFVVEYMCYVWQNRLVFRYIQIHCSNFCILWHIWVMVQIQEVQTYPVCYL